MEKQFIDLTLDENENDKSSTCVAKKHTTECETANFVFSTPPKQKAKIPSPGGSASSSKTVTFQKRSAYPLYSGIFDDLSPPKRRAVQSDPSGSPRIINAISQHSVTPNFQKKPVDLVPEQRARDTSTIQPGIRGLPRKRPIDLTKEAETSDAFLTGAREAVPISPIKNVTLRGLAFQPEGVTFKIGMDLELEDGSFLRIEKISKNGHRYLFYGRRLFRPKAFNGGNFPKIIPDTRNELVWVPQRTSPVLATKVVGISEIVFTNERGKWRESRTRTCRLKVSYKYRSGQSENPVKNANWVVRDISLRESDPGKGFTSQQLRERWRGHTTPFGEGKAPAIIEIIEQERAQSPEIIDLDNLMPTPPATPSTVIDLTADETNAYTFGDAFCGGGGASYGAKQAGLQLNWAFDSNQDAIMTYRLNFGPNVRSLCMEAFRFFSNPDSSLRIDIMHASPPCQTFSPAHTVNNEQRDDQNSACLLGMGDAIGKTKPRVVTMEETFGLDHEVHRPNLYRVIMDLVEWGYSVRWQIIKLSEYGVPQIRKRLVLIAVGPGEHLFDFPSPTHGLPGQPPQRTVRDAIFDLPEDAPNHDPEKRLRRWAREYRRPLDWDTQAKTITTSGGQDNYHPSGRRTMTDREVACLQTFPRSYRFSRKGVRKQVGNAFPPMAAKAIYEAAKRSLQETDEQEMQEMSMR